MLVEVKKGTIIHDLQSYLPGDQFYVSELQASSFEKLGVAKIVEQPVEEVSEVVETAEEPEVQTLEVVAPAQEEPPKKKKRGRKRG